MIIQAHTQFIRMCSKISNFFHRSWWNFARTIIRCSFGSAYGRPRKSTMKQKLPDTSLSTGSILISAWIIPKLRERVSNYFLIVKKLSLANIDITTKRHQWQLICLCLWGNFVLHLQILKAVYSSFHLRVMGWLFSSQFLTIFIASIVYRGGWGSCKYGSSLKSNNHQQLSLHKSLKHAE